MKKTLQVFCVSQLPQIDLCNPSSTRGQKQKIGFWKTFMKRNFIAAGSTTMRKLNLASMDFDELWDLHEELSKILAEKIRAEKRRLEERLVQLTHPEQIKKMATPLEER